MEDNVLTFSQDEIDMINYIKDIRDVVFSEDYDQIEFSSRSHYARQANAFMKAVLDKNNFDRRSDLLDNTKKAVSNQQRKMQSHIARFNNKLNQTKSFIPGVSQKKKEKLLRNDMKYQEKLHKLNDKFIDMIDNRHKK